MISVIDINCWQCQGFTNVIKMLLSHFKMKRMIQDLRE